MRPYHFIIVLFFLLSSILLSGCLAPSSAGTPMNNTAPDTLQVNVSITEDQNAIDGKSNLTFQFNTNLVQGNSAVQFVHNETVTCNGVTLNLDNPPYALSVPQGNGYNCSYRGYRPDIGLLTPVPIPMNGVPAGSTLAPQRPSLSSSGYTINYSRDLLGKGCTMNIDAKDSANNNISGSPPNDNGVYHSPDISSLVGAGSIILQRTCNSLPGATSAPFNTATWTYESIASVAVTWSY